MPGPDAASRFFPITRIQSIGYLHAFNYPRKRDKRLAIMRNVVVLQIDK